MSEPVAVLILEKIKTERGETAIWAVRLNRPGKGPAHHSFLVPRRDRFVCRGRGYNSEEAL